MKISTRRFYSLPVRFVLGVILVGAAALLFFNWILQPSPSDIQLMAVLLTLTCMLALVVGYEAYRLGWINRSPRLQITLLAGYLLSLLLTFLNVWVTARLMFTSQHDLLLATVLLAFAGGISIILGVFFTETLTDRIQKLNRAAHEIANGRFDSRVPQAGKDEMAQLAASFNTMAARLEQAEKEKVELDNLRRELVAWAGHDLRTPLASMRAIIEALTDGLVDDPDTTRRYLATARNDIQVLSTLIDDLFQMAQLDAGGLKLDLAAGSLVDLISETLESFSALARQKAIRLDGRIEPGIDLVWMDVPRVGRVLNNLVHNAIRYTPTGGSVYIHAAPQMECIRVDITDSGPGIPEADTPHIFERFYRGEKSRSRSSGGAGLGLAIARGIVEAHGGKIGFTNLPGGGAQFTFTLPLKANDSASLGS